MPHYKLHYFKSKGLGELPRLILTYAGVPFEDVRIERSEWPQVKDKMPFGQVPVLEVDGKHLAQSYAIARYIARENGLAGQPHDHWEQAQVDMYADSIRDLMNAGRPIYEETDHEKQKTLMHKFMTETMVPHLHTIEARLEKNGGVLVGNSVTWADIAYYGFFSHVMEKHPHILKDSPHLTALMNKIESNPKIKKYLDSRPIAEM